MDKILTLYSDLKIVIATMCATKSDYKYDYIALSIRVESAEGRREKRKIKIENSKKGKLEKRVTC